MQSPSDTFDLHRMRDRLVLLDRKKHTTAASYARMLQKYLLHGWRPTTWKEVLALQNAALAARRCAWSDGEGPWRDHWPDLRAILREMERSGAAAARATHGRSPVVVLVSDVGADAPQEAAVEADPGAGERASSGVRATCACCGRSAVVRGQGTFTEVGRGAALLVELQHRIQWTEPMHACEAGAADRKGGPAVIWLDPPAPRSCAQRRAALGPAGKGLRMRALELAMTRCHAVMGAVLRQFEADLDRDL